MRLILTSWRALLEAAEHHASAAGDIAAVTSIRQLNGLCEQQDGAAFVPFRPGELAPDIPRRLMDLPTIINRVVARAKEKGLLKWVGPATPAKDGYGRFLELRVPPGGTRVKGKPAGARLCVHYTAWSQYRETPVWLQLSEWKGALPLKKVRKRLRDKIVVGRDGTDFVPVDLPTGVELDDVVDSVVDRLHDLAHRIAGVAPD